MRAELTLMQLFRDKASYLAVLDRKDEAFQAYEQSRKLASHEFDGELAGWVLEDIALLFDEDRDPGGQSFMNTLRTWKDREFRNWLDYHLMPFADIRALGRMFRASKLTGEIELVLDRLNNYGRKLPPRSLAAFNLQYALGDFYSSVLRDVDKAKDALHSVLLATNTLSILNAQTRAFGLQVSFLTNFRLQATQCIRKSLSTS
jgi:hypothetical protein